MITKNSLNVVKEYSIPCVNKFNGDYRTFTIMARSLLNAKKVLRMKFKSWNVLKDKIVVRIMEGFSTNYNIYHSDENTNSPLKSVDMRIVRRMNPTFDDDVKLDKMLSRWIGC